ncbi:MAG TPA: T9SS type A sorting domain-containing protein [Candidatus Kapabacteria bacterium]|nr:T9SS type A sorting domain-containing protein [Candidatus Kapabacteria bacterium]
MLTNQPNPFNDQTEITYKIPENEDVQVNISSINGELKATYKQGNQETGIYNILFDGSNLLGGVYVLDLIFENERVQSVMILIK